MGVFRHLQNHGGGTAKLLAESLGAEEGLVGRILRPLVAEGLLAQSAQGVYEVTKHGSVFGLPAYEDSCKFAVEFLPVVLFNPTFFHQYGYREPRSHEGLHTPLATYFQKPGYGFFDYIDDHPSVQKFFISAMHAQVRTKSLSCSVYDYGTQAMPVTDDVSRVAIVDVGGSRGELLQDIQARYPQLKGRMIVQDRESTFQDMEQPPPGIQLMVHDIFTEQPVKGAAIYHLKRILHDWGDDEARIILKHLVSAMDRKWSKVLIMDSVGHHFETSDTSKILIWRMSQVLPSTDISLSQAMSDHSMLTFGGKERSEGEWVELLTSVGLTVLHIHQGPEPEALIECRKA
ncbi:hypothetical protein N7445_008115 [Penicillium cf. griseofulvum]|nr:hypothetical protein N7445_008115 [Penicillium cf. griseofulvum]